MKTTQHDPIPEKTSQLTLDDAFEFRGNGTEYFKIWIVNIFLTIITLGIYSAWAKVRTEKYFHSNLYLHGSNFDYLARPIQILIGRIIAVLFFAALSAIDVFSETIIYGATLVFLLFIPWIVARSISFSRRMTSYRNIQFSFSGGYFGACQALFLWPLLGVITLGLLFPLAMKKINAYLIENSAYGTSHFSSDLRYRDYAMIFLKALGMLFIIIPIYILGFVNVHEYTNGNELELEFGIKLGLGLGVGIAASIVSVIISLFLFAFIKISMFNIFYKNMSLAGYYFDANVPLLGYTTLMVNNFFRIIITLGLYLPVAKARKMKFLAKHMNWHVKDSLDDFIAAEKQNVNAVGGEVAGVLDLELDVI